MWPISLDNVAGIGYIMRTPEGREAGRKEVNELEMRVIQVAFQADGQVLVLGIPTNDATKVVVAAASSPREALLLAMAVATQDGDIVVDPPEDAIVAILEQP